MSRHHTTIAHEASNLIREVESMTADEAEQIHGIKQLAGGKIFDSVYQLNFETLMEWATLTAEQDHVENFEHVGGGHDYDDY